jgi:glycosyltransferase involved in cell wall biosynthesis
MKIGFDAKRFFFNHSGLGNYSRMLVESLFKYFPENEYVLYADRLDALDHAHPEALRILKLYVDNRSDGSDLYTLVMVDAPKWWRTWGLGKRAAQDGVEVFHGLSNELPWDLPASVAGVCTIHDVIFKEFPAYYPWIDRLIYDFKTKKSIQKASRLIMTSQATQSQVEKYYPNAKGRSVVVYQAVDPAFYGDGHVQRSRETNAPYFVYQSSFTQRKNHAVLVDAFALIQHQTDWNLRLIGLNGPTLAAVQLQIEKLGLGNRITCLVDQSRQEMIDCVTGAAGFVYPSLNEGFGIPLAEALAAGLPMAVSNISVFRELTEDLPVYFHPNNADEMAAAMISITTQEEQTRQRLKRPSLQNKIDPQNIASQLMQTYSFLRKS